MVAPLPGASPGTRGSILTSSRPTPRGCARWRSSSCPRSRTWTTVILKGEFRAHPRRADRVGLPDAAGPRRREDRGAVLNDLAWPMEDRRSRSSPRLREAGLGDLPQAQWHRGHERARMARARDRVPAHPALPGAEQEPAGAPLRGHLGLGRGDLRLLEAREPLLRRVRRASTRAPG